MNHYLINSIYLFDPIKICGSRLEIAKEAFGRKKFSNHCLCTLRQKVTNYSPQANVASRGV